LKAPRASLGLVLIPASPRINPDLLQRSEVVALINTLHRVSESLASVDDFRQMYAATQAQEAEVAKEKARMKKSAHAAYDSAISTTIIGLLISAYEGFRRGCQGCLEVCLNSLERSPLGQVLDWLRGALGQVVSKVDL